MDWTEFYTTAERHAKWPTEYVTRLVLGRQYLARPFTLNQGSRIVDVGCGGGANLLPFADRCEVFGVEISDPICAVARDFLASKNVTADIRAGGNRTIPFDDKFFNLAMSINAIHYEPTEAEWHEAVAELARVSPQVLISTVAPEHDVFKTAKHVGGRVYEFTYDWRQGARMTYFTDPDDLAREIGKHFSHVEIGRETQRLMKTNLDVFIVAAHN